MPWYSSPAEFPFFFSFSPFNPCIIPMEWRSAKVPKVFSCFPLFSFPLLANILPFAFGKRRPFPRNKIDSTRVYSSSPFFLFIIIFALYACCFSTKGKDAYTGGNNYPTQTQKRKEVESFIRVLVGRGPFLCLFLHLFLFFRPFLQDHPSHPRVTWIRIASLSLPLLTTTIPPTRSVCCATSWKTISSYSVFPPFKTFTNDR